MALQTFNPDPRPTDSDEKPEVKLKKAEFGDGYTQTSRDGLNHIREVLSLSWESLTATQAQAIYDFFKSHGGDIPFWYTPSDSTTPIKFTCEEWSRKKTTPNTMTATLKQSFNLGT
jgi:phage-related protein